VERRHLLKLAGLAVCGAGVACASGGRVRIVGATRRLWPVSVAKDRVVRTVAGLRPFRPSGFVVRANKLDAKLLVHNYGHGGAGVSLSWGTAHLAVEEVAKKGADRYAVLGCGAVGLATARLLQRRGGAVTIYARDLPPSTTSNIAGAHWGAFGLAERDKRTPAFDAQYQLAATLSHRMFQDLVGDDYGVRWIDTYVLARGRPAPIADDAVADALDRLDFDAHELARGEHPFDAAYVRRFVTMLIEPPVYLNALMRDFLLAGGRIVVKEFGDVTSIVQLPEPVVVNCTGLGSRMLFNDQELIPAKGQLTVLLPQVNVDYAVLAEDNLYMFPRRDGILLGGTFERENWSLEPDPNAAERILKAHADLFGRMRT
jgi:D-amino-acid oxidase